jgi:PASTA domain-containing protein
VIVARPASWYEETELEDEAPEVLPEELLPPAAVPAQRQRTLLDHAWLVLAVLGLALAAAAAIWFVRLRPAPPASLGVPSVVGLSESRAVSALTTEGFRVRAVEESSSSGGAVVRSQRPGAETRLARGATVTIHVAGRPDRSIAGR